MNTNDIKKALYKENPKAELLLVSKDGIAYQSSLKSGQVLFFCVPFNDIGEAIFRLDMDAKLLIRYLTPIVDIE